MGTRRDLSVTIESHDKDKNYCSDRSFHNISMWSLYLQHMVKMKYEFFVIKPRTSTKAEEVSPGIEVTQIKCFVMCHATSKHNLQVILARGGWVETHPRHSQLVAPGIVCLSLHNERIFLSFPEMLPTVNNEREQWSCFSFQSDKFAPKSRKLFLLFYAVTRLQSLMLSRTQTLGRRGGGSCPLLKSWVKLFNLHINVDHSSTS